MTCIFHENYFLSLGTAEQKIMSEHLFPSWNSRVNCTATLLGFFCSKIQLADNWETLFIYWPVS
jgi:hypothetical protein